MQKIVVVGAGILGASTAYTLTKLGAKVIIVDRKDDGQATDAAAGIVCPWISQRRNKAWYRLAKAGARFYPSLINDLKNDGESETGYVQIGALSIQKDPEKLNKIVDRAQLRRQDAPEMGTITQFSQEETKALFPPLDEAFAAVSISGGARVDGRKLRDSLLRAAQKNGAKLLNEGAELLWKETEVLGVKAGGTTITADSVIICAGAWARQLLKPLGVDFNVKFQKAQIVHLDLANLDTDHWPVIMPPGTIYLLAFEDNRVVAGSTHEDLEEYDTAITAGGLQEIFTKALDVAPGLSKASFLEARVGFRPYTPGFLPVIGAVPGYKRIFTANGLGASGLTVGPYLGSQLARLALGLETEIDLEAYSVGRAIN